MHYKYASAEVARFSTDHKNKTKDYFDIGNAVLSKRKLNK